MQYRKLGKSGFHVSVIGLGTWQLGGEWGKTFSQKDADDMVAQAQDLGINFLDTAECYGNHWAEQLAGRALKGRRRHWTLATKFGHRFQGFMNRLDLWSPKEVQQQLEDSLKALGADYIDHYQFHSGTMAQLQTPGLWEMLRRQVEAGKILSLGVSIAMQEQEEQVEWACSHGMDAVQIVYNRINREPEKKSFVLAQKHEMGVIVRSPLVRGLLGGQYKPGDEKTFGSNDNRSLMDQKIMAVALAEVDHLKKEAAPGATPAAWALAWCLKNPAVTTVIPGISRVSQILDNAKAASLADPAHPLAAPMIAGKI